MRVTQVNIKFKDSIPDDGDWVDRAAYSASIAEDNFCRFELIEAILSDDLTLEKLMGHSLIKAPQSAQTLKAKTINYIFETLGKEFI